MAKSGAVHAKQGEGQALWMLGSLYDIRVSKEAQGADVTVAEMTIQPGGMVPPHVHKHGEVVYVLEGTFRFHTDGRAIEAGQGDILFFPKNTQEWFENPGSAPGRVLVIYSKPGIEKFFSEVAEPAQTRTLPPASSEPPDMAKIEQAAKKHGLKLFPPPPQA